MYHCGTSNGDILAVASSVLTVTILCNMFSPATVNSHTENDSTFDRKCAEYHASSPSEAGIVVGGHPSGLSVDTTRSVIYTIDSSSKKISAIDSTTDTLSKTISITGIKPVGLGRNGQVS